MANKDEDEGTVGTQAESLQEVSPMDTLFQLLLIDINNIILISLTGWSCSA